MDTNRIESALNRIKDAEGVIANCKREIVEAAGGEAPLPLKPTGKDLEPRKARGRGKRLPKPERAQKAKREATANAKPLPRPTLSPPKTAKPPRASRKLTEIDAPRLAFVRKRLSVATGPLSAEQISASTGLDTKVCAAACKQLGCSITGSKRGTKYALPIATTIAPAASANPVTGRTRKPRAVAQPGERKVRPISDAALDAVRGALASGNHDSGSITDASQLTKPNALLAPKRLVEAGEVTKTGSTKDARWTLETAPAKDAGDE